MKPRILIPLDHYLPGVKSGGQLRSLHNMAQVLRDEFDFLIVTRDRDLGDDTRYEGLEVDTWTERPEARVLYLAPDAFTSAKIVAVAEDEEANLIYSQGFFSRVCTRELMQRKELPAPHLVLPNGELLPGAMALKRAKKQLYLMAGRLSGLFSRARFHATSADEEAAIRRLLPGRPVFLAPTLTERTLPPWSPREKTAGVLRLAFVSRISPKKNLHRAIELLAKIPGEVSLDVYGPVEDPAYWTRCQQLITTLPPSKRVVARGPTDPAGVLQAFSQAHAFLFPTLGENHGHVVPEALSAGAVLVIADTTPWRNLQAEKAGWDLALDDEPAWVAALTTLSTLDQGEFDVASRAAYAYAERLSNDRQAETRSRALLHWALADPS